MCGGSDQSESASSPPSNSVESETNINNMNNLTDETEDSFSSLLELAANNDFEGFNRCIERDASKIDEVGLWYGRKKGSKQMVLEHRTPLMVAATYGSVEVLRIILDKSAADVNLSCGPDKSTALHCAASGGSDNSLDVVKMLLAAGADTYCMDANGNCPADVIVVPPKPPGIRVYLEELLMNNASNEHKLRLSINTSSSNSPPLSSSPEDESLSTISDPDSVSSPVTSKHNDLSATSALEKKEYPIDPSLPDIKNSIYSTDEFRMFSFKVRPCSRAYSHDWTECPFVHPGENARRRDPRKFHYSCVPCPDFRKGACRRGDMCEYAHGVFECWLHPAQYRTRLCKDGISCNRRVCFFAHTSEELRPLFASTGSAVPSPRSAAANAMDMAAAMSLFAGSPSALSPSQFAQPMSPSANGISHSSMAWPQPNVPTLHLPGSNFQSSRLRSSLSARDIPPEDFNMLLDFDAKQQLLNDLTFLSQSPTLNRSSGRTKTLTPSNLEELFSAELSLSPRYADQSVFSPSHKSALLNQFQQQQQSMLSPIKNTEHHHPLMQSSFGLPASGRMSPRSMESPISPMGGSRLSPFAQREKPNQQLRSLSSRELGSNFNTSSVVGSPVNSWSKWGSPTGKVDWSVNGDELGLLQRSSSFGHPNNGEEKPDVTWVQSVVKETPTDMKEKLTVPISGAAEGLNLSSQHESTDHSVLGAWLEQMQFDHQLHG